MNPPNAVIVSGDLSALDPTSALAGRRLLEHPFYRRWERGEVSMAELADYAEQYRHFEALLPTFLGELVAELPEGPAKDLVAANLADEQGDPVAHVELFEQFAGAVGARPIEQAPASAATRALVDSYAGSVSDGPVSALAGFIAYECQASEVARSKAEGLRNHYGMDDLAVSFWEHHARVDARHGEWALEALGDLSESLDPGARAQILPAFRRGADAWWSFLDERELTAVR
jgi:pyrroloquinoline-quinone synthase